MMTMIHGMRKKKMTFDEWVNRSGVYYHLSHRDGDWSQEQALKKCWEAAQSPLIDEIFFLKDRIRQLEKRCVN